MTTDRPKEELPAVPPSGDLARFSPELLSAAREAIEKGKSPATRRGYEDDWGRFVAWCRSVGAPFLPAEPGTIVLYLTHLVRERSPQRGRFRGKPVGLSPAAVARARASISHFHREGACPSCPAWAHPGRKCHEVVGGRPWSNPTLHPKVREAVMGLRAVYHERAEGKDVESSLRKERPLMPEHLAAIVGWLGKTRDPATFLRDRAILLGGFAAGYRRAELVGARRSDVRIRSDGVHFAIVRQQGAKKAEEKRGAKGDRLKVGQSVSFVPQKGIEDLSIPQALREWSDASGGDDRAWFIRKVRRGEVTDDPISSRKVDRLVKECAAAVGLKDEHYGAHSLRAGVATWKIWVLGEDLITVRDYMRHKSVATLEGYVRDWDELPPSKEVGHGEQAPREEPREQAREEAAQVPVRRRRKNKPPEDLPW